MPKLNGLLIYEAEPWSQWARIKCSKCGWSRDDPNFMIKKSGYFPSDSEDRRIEWRQEHPGYDLYDPSSAACQLKISASYFKDSVRDDPMAPVIMSCGLIACNTPELQSWWDGKIHHSRKNA